MSGPFQKLESLGLDGLDDSLACVDGVCAVPTPAASAEGVGEKLSLGVAEGDLPDRGER
jgi:hypothetical protein